MDFKKHFGKKKAYFYMSKLSPKQIKQIKFRKIMWWIVGMPIQIWRIPYSLFYMLIKALGYINGLEGLYSVKYILFVLLVIAIVPGIVSAIKMPLLCASVLFLMYVMYMIYRCSQEIRKGYWQAYNAKMGYNNTYDEYAAKYAKDEEDYQYEGYGYNYYYDSSENRGYYSSYNSKYDYSNANSSGSSGNNHDNGGNKPRYRMFKNRFMGLDKNEAKEKYRELMKIYHPDNAETGDADISKQIIAEYEEYKDMYE